MKIALDPGHGQDNRDPYTYDPGATAGGFSEAAIVLSVALTVKFCLQQQNIPTFLTRGDEHDRAPLSERVRAARIAGCTHYIALHMNSAGFLATGTETLWGKREDIPLAGLVQNAALSAFGLRDRRVVNQQISPNYPLAVMAFPGPVCLVEMGFISNPWDRARFTKEPDARNRRLVFGKALAEGLLKI